MTTVSPVQLRLVGAAAEKFRKIQRDMERATGRTVTYQHVVEALLAEHERTRTEDMP
jgi:hypothetical protein